MTSPFKVVVDGVDVSAQVDPQWLTVTIPTSRRGATASLHLLDTSPPAGLNAQPPASVVIYDIDGVTPIFDGLVTKAQVRVESVGNMNRWILTAQDATFYFDAVLINEIYTDVTVDEVIADIFAKYMPAVDATTLVQPGPPISAISFPWVTITEALRKLLTYTQDTDTVVWYVTPQLELFWGTIAQLASSGLTLTDVLPPTSGTPFGLQGQGGYYQWELDFSQVVTQVVIRGATILSQPLTETFVADGQATSFALAYQPSQQKTAQPVTLTINGNGASIQFDNGTVPTTQWVVVNQLFGSATSQPGSSAVRTGTDPAPAAGSIVSVTYEYDIPLIAVVDDLVRQADYNVPGALTAGVYQQVITDQTLRTVQSARARGTGHLASYAPILQVITIPLMEDFGGLVPTPGTTVVLDTVTFGLNTTYVITQVQVRGTADAQRQIILTVEGL